MKMYYNTHHLRIVGKAWQIRAKLKELSQHQIKVKDLLDRMASPSVD